MKKGTILCLAASVLGIPAAVVACICVSKGGEYREAVENGVYLEGTVLSVGGTEINAGGMTPGQAYERYLKTAGDAGSLSVTFGGRTHEIDLGRYSEHTVSVRDFEESAEKEVPFMDFLFGKGTMYTLGDEYVYTGGVGDEIREIINSGDYDYIRTEDAYFDKEEMKVVPEVYGTEIIPGKAAEIVEDAASEGAGTVSLEGDIYVKPEVTEDDIREKYADVLRILEWKAEYSVSDHVIRMSDYKDRITVNDDGSYRIDSSFLKDAVLALSKTIDRKYDSIEFDSEKDGRIKVKGGTYGSIMKNSKETEYLKGKLEKGESVSGREPAWLCRPLEDGKNPDDYIEVDLSEQHVWHYADGELCCESDCVTGNTSLKRGTPEGAYYISERIPGKYLTGADYKTWVDRWMRLTNSGIGLHDAKWKKKFGGNIYKTNGSHGCINLPVKYAYKLYDETEVGMLVVVHK